LMLHRSTGSFEKRFVNNKKENKILNNKILFNNFKIFIRDYFFNLFIWRGKINLIY
jgi:hypothetical protein